jgi:FkbM family methyltransferase
MKPNNPNFWTDINGQLVLRNLEREESIYRDNIFPAWSKNQIDEPILIYYEVYDCHSGGYIDDSLYQFNECFIKEGDVVLDLGANIGIFTRFASDKGAKKVYSFEPVQENFRLLSLNRPDNCEAHRIAISNKDNDAVQISYKPNCPGGSSIIKYEDGILQTCMTMTVDTLINNGVIEQPDFIKMDIEGAEALAFEGISDDVLRKTRCITMEMHEDVIGKEDSDKIYDRLRGLGFKPFTLYNPDNNNIVWFTNNNLI